MIALRWRLYRMSNCVQPKVFLQLIRFPNITYLITSQISTEHTMLKSSSSLLQNVRALINQSTKRYPFIILLPQGVPIAHPNLGLQSKIFNRAGLSDIRSAVLEHGLWCIIFYKQRRRREQHFLDWDICLAYTELDVKILKFCVDIGAPTSVVGLQEIRRIYSDLKKRFSHCRSSKRCQFADATYHCWGVSTVSLSTLVRVPNIYASLDAFSA